MNGAAALRAPRADGAVLARPPLEHICQLLEQNRARSPALDSQLAKHFPLDLRRRARASAVEAARIYLAQGDEPVAWTASDSLLVAGHQPELFHAGVWVKHFALHGLARRHQATPLNLIVDNDTAKATSLRLPAWPGQHPEQVRVRQLRFDAWRGEVPYEERRILDRELFASLPERAAEVTRGWPFRPLLPDFWREVLRQAQRTDLVGECFAAARRRLERGWGCANLEVPVSLLCETEPFAWFACHLLVHLPAFRAIYNRVVSDYRRQHGIRSRHHPVPDLAEDGDWLEAPFWAWHADKPRRQKLFVRHASAAVEVRAGEEIVGLPCHGGTEGLIAPWLALRQRGLKIRSRALTTTMYARLFLADLFIHGIGGAKYDQLTDEILRQFYGIEPPGFMILSATLLLPFQLFAANGEALRHLTGLRRDLWYNPQRHLTDCGAAGAAQQLAQEKQAWIDRPVNDYVESRQRHLALKELTDRLHPHVEHRQRLLDQESDDCRQQLDANGNLARRDYPFCLHPEEKLRALWQQFVRS